MTSPAATLGLCLLAAACLLAGLALGQTRSGQDGHPATRGPWSRRLLGLGIGLLGMLTMLLGLSIAE